MCVVNKQFEFIAVVMSVVVFGLLFSMIRSVVKSFKVPKVDVVAARMSNESALTRMPESTPKIFWSVLTLILDGRVDSNLPDERSSSGRFHHFSTETRALRRCRQHIMGLCGRRPVLTR